MANIYVRSTTGSDTFNGSTWSLAKATIEGAAAIDAVGDTVYVSQAHTQSATSSLPSWDGTIPIPTRILCANDGAQPPTASATSAVIQTTGSINLTFTSGAVYHGFTFNCGTGSNAATLTAGGVATTLLTLDTCNLAINTTNTGALMALDGPTVLLNCTLKFSAAAQFARVGYATRISGGGIASGGTSPTTVFKGNTAGTFLVEGFDFSNCSAGVNLYDPSSGSINVGGVFRDCKLPASWSGSLVATPANLTHENVIEMRNCAAGAINYAYWRQTYAGSVRHETTIVRTGGASDGTTPLSWKMVSTANASYPSTRLESEDLYALNNVVGTPVTATVEVVTDNVTLKDDEAYIEVFYLGSSAAPLATRITDAKSDIIAAGANQASSSATWTTTGLTTPVTQQLSVTFTPQMVGVIIARVVLAKASTTMYADPKLVLT